MTNPLRIGIIGAGANTRALHIPGFQKQAGVEVAVVCNRSEASSQQVADAFNIPRIAADWREVVDDPEVDAVCIGTWPYLHAEASIAALEAGKHVLTEARMAMDFTQAQQMLAASQAHPELVAQVVPAPFSFKYDATIQRLLADNALGALREIRVAHLMAANADPSTPMTWRQDTALSGKNIMTMGIFYETVQRWLGEQDPTWVQATGAIFTQERTDASDELRTVGIPDTLNLTAGYANGSQLSMTISSVANGANYMGIRVDGEAASLRYDLSADMLFQTKVGEAEEPVDAAASDQAVWRVEEDFVGAIREGKPITLTSFADGVRYMRFTERVWESWTHDGQRVAW